MRKAWVLCLLLAGCATADFEVVEGAPPEDAVTAVATPDELASPGLFAGLFGGRAEPAAQPVPEAETAPDGEEDVAEAAEAETTEVETAEAEPAPRRGLFAGLLNRSPAPETEPADTMAAVAEDLTAEPEAPAPTPAAAPAARGGLFGRLRGGNNAGSGEDAAVPVEELKYGMVIPACGTPRRALGTEVARFPERGRGGYRLYDTNPSTIALRPHYITGFSDGCPRKFLAALALFGDIGAYETTRYKDGRNTTTVTETDTRYKTIRARACGTPVGRDCPEARFERLSRNAVFVSVYQRFGTSPTWADMLIHDGRVVAKDFKAIR